MSFLENIKKLLNSPYPYPENLLDEFKSILIASFIVGFLLYAFEPFGLAYYRGSKLKVVFVFMLITFVVGFLHTYVTRRFFDLHIVPERHTFRRWLVGIISLLFFISLANFIATVWLFNSQFNLTTFLANVGSTILIGIFPTTLFGFRYLLKMERLNTQRALEMNQRLDHSFNQHTSMETIAVQAMENYVIIYKASNNRLDKVTERRTLSSVTTDHTFKNLVKCHRSYLVNPDHVVEINGNAQGLKLTLSHQDCPIIPVSRSYIDKIKSRLHSTKKVARSGQ